jgi:MbtH protein
MSNNQWQVVINHEEQWWSILPSNRPIPAGCQSTGQQGSREECLRYIATVWTDMRPLKITYMG